MQTWLRAALIAGAMTLFAGTAAAGAVAGAPLRIGTTPVILEDQVTFLRAWQSYLESRLQRPVEFVQRGNYQEITDLLVRDKLDFAWVCGYPFVRNRAAMRLLAVPLYRGRPVYQSYLIVPATDTRTRGFPDLRGRIFAYSDPNSNSGFLVPTYELLRAGEDPSTFYRKTFFTWGHRKVVQAVAAGLAQGGAVDGYVWETLALTEPGLTGRTRVVRKSDEYGFPPLVARASIDERDFRAFQAVLVEMSGDPQGRPLLRQLNLDGFAREDTQVFDGIAQVVTFVDSRRPPQAAR
jgi:phosphonate transport system substrate-binding protein